MNKQTEQTDCPSPTDDKDMEYWHKLCCLRELGWSWDSVYHFAPWKNKDGERARFKNVDEAIKAHQQKFPVTYSSGKNKKRTLPARRLSRIIWPCDRKGKCMDQDKYDAMVQKMTLALREIYELENDKKLGEMEAQSLNDTLDAFFRD